MAKWRHTGRLRVADRGPHEAEPYARVGTDDRCATCGDIIERLPVRVMAEPGELQYPTGVRSLRDIAADQAREALEDGAAVFDKPSGKATVFMVVQTDDDQDEAWWVLHNEDTRADAMEAAGEIVEILTRGHYFPERLEDSKGSRRPDA